MSKKFENGRSETRRACLNRSRGDSFLISMLKRNREFMHSWIICKVIFTSSRESSMVLSDALVPTIEELIAWSTAVPLFGLGLRIEFATIKLVRQIRT